MLDDCLSVCPSVRLSVKRAICDKAVESSAQFLIPYERSFYSYSLITRGRRHLILLYSSKAMSNGKAFLEQAVQQIDWSRLYRLANPDDMVTYFNSTICQLLDQYMLPHPTRQHLRDKPWVDDHFRYLIRRRQFAWRHGRWNEYCAYRNRVQRTSWR